MVLERGNDYDNVSDIVVVMEVVVRMPSQWSCSNENRMCEVVMVMIAV